MSNDGPQGIPEHVDHRTHKFFKRGFVGKLNGKHGEDEYGYVMSWDSRHDDLKPSTTYGQSYCVYCGKRPYPIQPNDRGFDVTGYVCLCTDATNEVELNAQREEMEERHTKELYLLTLKLPKPSDDVKLRIIESKLKDDHHGYDLDRCLKALRVV